MDEKKDQVRITVENGRLTVEERYDSLGVVSKSTYTNTDEYEYGIVKNQRDGTVLLKRVEKKTGKECYLDAYDSNLSRIKRTKVTYKMIVLDHTESKDQE